MTCKMSLTIALAAALGAAAPLSAHDGDHGADMAPETASSEATVALVARQAIPEIAGKLVMMATVSYAPGQASAPHMHPGSIFAYVLEGSVVSQLEGQPAKTYSQGQSWYEPPRAHHLVSKNASATKPARMLVWTVMKEHEPIKTPLPR